MLYQQQGQGAQAGAGQAAGPGQDAPSEEKKGGDDDVIDADFEVKE